MRKAICFPLVGVGVSVRLEPDGSFADCRVVLTGVGPQPVVVPIPQALLEGKTLTQELVDHLAEKATNSGNPVANTSGSTPAYRRRMAGMLTRRAVLAIAKDLG